MKNSMREGMEDKTKRSGCFADIKDTRTILRILGKTYIPEVVEPTQSKETIRRNVEIIEQEIFAACGGSKDRYLGRVMKAIVSEEMFPSELTEGCMRWCLEEGREICKVVVKADHDLWWAVWIDAEAYVEKTYFNKDIVDMPLGDTELLQELAWRDFFKCAKQMKYPGSKL